MFLLTLMLLTLALGTNTQARAQETTASAREAQLKEAKELVLEVVKLIEQDKYAEAMPKAMHVLEMRQQIFGPQHVEVAPCLVNIGYIFFKTKDYAKARDYYSRALKIYEQSKVEDSGRASTLNNFGLLCYAEGDRINAERFFRDALATLGKLPLGSKSLSGATMTSNLALVLFEKGDLEAAGRLFRDALSIQEGEWGQDDPRLIPLLNYIASVDHQLGHDQAIPLLTRALDIVARKFEHDPPVVLPVVSNLMLFYLEAGSHEKVEVLARRTLALLETNPGEDLFYIAAAYNSLGRFHKVKSEYKKAESFYRRALNVLESASLINHPYASEVLTHLGLLYVEQGEYTQAEDALERARTMRESYFGPDHPMFATSLANLGDLYRAQGDYDKAESLLEEALTIYEKTIGKHHPYYAAVINNLGLVHYSRGDLKRAAERFRESLNIREQVLHSEHPDIAISLSNLANCLAASGDLAQAQKLLQRALTIFEHSRGPNDQQVARTLNELGLLHQRQGDSAAAEVLLRRALATYEKQLGPEHVQLTPTLNNLGLLYQSLGDLDQAEQFYSRAIGILENSKIPKHPVTATVLENLSTLYNARGDIPRAVSSANRAAEIEEHNLAITFGTGSENQNRNRWLSLYNHTMTTISLHVRDAPNNVPAARLALTTILRRKGRVLDATTGSMLRLRERSSQADKVLLDKLSVVRSQIAAEIAEDPNRTGSTYNPDRLSKLEEEYQRLEARVSAEFRSQYEPVTIERIQKLIPPGAALLEFIDYRPFNAKTHKLEEKWEPRRYVVYVLLHNGEVKWADLGNAFEIDDSIWDLRIALRDPSREDIKALARATDEKIMRPVRNLAGKSRWLFVSPDVSLQLIPFEALVNEHGQYLTENYLFTNLTSARDLQRSQFSAASRQPPLIVANPNFNLRGSKGKSSLPDAGNPSGPKTGGHTVYQALAGTEEEANQIAAVLPHARVWKGPEAIEAALKQVHGPSILHIATHGFFPRNVPWGSSDPNITKIDGQEVFKPSIINLKLEIQPSAQAGLESMYSMSQSGLVFAGANNSEKLDGDDGILTAFEASGLDLYGTKLVVLSACETAIGNVENANGVYGLKRALLLAGAESQVMSLWKVDDRTTRDIMTSYYTRLKAREGRSEALRQVRLEMLRTKKYRHPYFWASFIQAGDWRSMDLNLN